MRTYSRAPVPAGPDTWRDRVILTPEYAPGHKPPLQFFNSEDRRAALPNRSYFTYQAPPDL